MVEKEVTIRLESGLHARPAADFVKKAKNYKSRIQIIKDSKILDAKSIVGLLSLGLSKGTAITIRAEGEDEAEALEALIPMVLEPSERK